VRSNSKAWITRKFFTEWFHEVFAPAVRDYLKEKNLRLRSLLLMDNAPSHTPGLNEDLSDECDFIEVMFLPSNTTPLIQPMDQQVISNFKKLYTKALFQQCFHVTSNSDLTLREFWKDHFNIFHCLRLIEKAWDQISERCLCSAWKKLWLPPEPPEVPCDSEGSESEQTHEEVTVMEEIVTLGVRLGLDVDENDVNTLVEEHNAQLTTQDLQELHIEQQQEVTGELSSEDDVEVQCKAAEIKDFYTIGLKCRILLKNGTLTPWRCEK
jgi:hypothetical protein